MLNSIGLANPGRERFLAETLPRLRELGLPLWVSVGGFSAREYAETCERLEDVTVELNLSCPNVDEAPESAAEIVAACRAATSLPLYAKLSPAAWDIAEVARAVEAAGADGLSLVNTMRGLALDERTLRPVLGDRRRAATRARRCGRSRSPPSTPAGARPTFRSSGWAASRPAATRSSSSPRAPRAVALGTVLFADPDAPARIRAELDGELERLGLDSLDAVRGVAHAGGIALRGPAVAGPASA